LAAKQKEAVDTDAEIAAAKTEGAKLEETGSTLSTSFNELKSDLELTKKQLGSSVPTRASTPTDYLGEMTAFHVSAIRSNDE
jgi:hypothetical protein